LLAPHKQSRFGTASSQRIQRRLMSAFIEEFWQRLFFRPADVHGFTVHDLGDVRRLIIHVADQNRLGRTNHYAGGLQADIDAVRAEVTFLSRMIFGIDEDGVVRTGGHTGLTADADRFVEVDDAVRALEHSGGRARSHARRVRALIAARDLMGSTHLWEHPHVHVLDVCPRDTYGDDVLRLARGSARMATDTASVVDNLRPLDAFISS